MREEPTTPLEEISAGAERFIAWNLHGRFFLAALDELLAYLDEQKGGGDEDRTEA